MPSLNEGVGRKVGASAAHSSEIVSDGNGRQGAHVSEMQRRRLLSALAEVLGEHGYEGATVGRICKRGGVSRRTFYDLYDDREGCFLDALEEVIAQITAQVAPAFGGEGRWRERVRRALVVLLECFDAELGLARLCLVETLKGAPTVLECRRSVIDALIVAIDEGRTEAKGADPPPLTSESLVGGAISVIHARILEPIPQSLLELVNPLMSMLVLPYLGAAASHKELERPVPVPSVPAKGSNCGVSAPASNPFRDLPIRITFRTVRVLSTIGVQPDASNREIGEEAGVNDQGQMSKLLRRLEKTGLIVNRGEGQVRGEANAWRLTARGHGVLQAIGGDSDA